MENEISSIPPSTPAPISVLEKETLKPKRKFSFKNLLIGFFIVEHLVIFFLLLIPVIFFIRTYASTDFIALSDKASKFEPEDDDVVMHRYFDKYQNYVIDFVRPENIKPLWDVEIAEKDINSMLASLKLDRINKVYIEPDEENYINLWVKTDVIPYPIIIRAKIDYSYEQKVFNVDIVSWAIASLTFPAEILNFVEDSINENLWNNVDTSLSKNAIHLNKLETQKGKIIFQVQIDDKVKFTETVLNSSGR